MALIWLCAALILAAVLVIVWSACAAAGAWDADFEEIAEPERDAPEPAERETWTVYPGVPLTDEFQRYLAGVCAGYGVPVPLALAVIAKESDFDAGLVGDEGRSFGLMQIQPFWHRERMEALGVIDLLDPSQNVRVGVDYLAELLAEGRGIEWAVMAYNGGYDHADYCVGKGVLTGYATEVMRMFECMTDAGIPIEK